MSVFIILFFLFYFCLAWYRFPVAIQLLLASLPAYLLRFKIFNLPTTLLEVMILIVFIVFVIRNYRIIWQNFWRKAKGIKARSQSAYPFDKEIILFLIIAYLAVFVGGFSISALGLWRAYFFEPILVYLLVLNVLIKQFGYTDQEKAFSFVGWPLTFNALILAVWAGLQKIIGWGINSRFWPRATSIFPYPNALGLYLAPIILLLFGWLVFRIKNKHNLSFYDWLKNVIISLAILLSILAVFFAQSEGALVGLAAGFFVFAVLTGKKSRYLAGLAITLTALTIMVYPTAKTYCWQKVTLHDLSGEIRRRQWSETIKMLTSSPKRFVLGAGLAKYQSAIKPYHQPGFYFNKENDPDFKRKLIIFNDKYRTEHWQPVEIYLYPHNIILNFWSELGLTGLLIFFWLLSKSLFILILNFKTNFSYQEKYLTLGLMSSLITIIIHGLVDVPYFKNDLACLFWLLLALTAWLLLGYNKNRAIKTKL